MVNPSRDPSQQTVVVREFTKCHGVDVLHSGDEWPERRFVPGQAVVVAADEHRDRSIGVTVMRKPSRCAAFQPKPRGGKRRPEFPDVLGWQPLALNREQDCADCQRTLTPGVRAFIGLTEAGMSRTILCRDCMNARSD